MLRRRRGPAELAVPGLGQLVEIEPAGAWRQYVADEIGTTRKMVVRVVDRERLPPRIESVLAEEIRVLSGLTNARLVAPERLVRPDKASLGLVSLHMPNAVSTEVSRSGADLDHVIMVGALVADSLAAAHGAGLAHGELAPAWIRFDAIGQPWLDGWCLIHAAADDDIEAEGDEDLGRPVHLAPEQLEGIVRADRASDIYALGSTLFQMATGQAPFTAFVHEGPASVVLRVLNDPPPTMRDVPPTLSDLIGQLLRKDPASRPTDAAWIAARLRIAITEFSSEVRYRHEQELGLASSSTAPFTDAGHPARQDQWTDLSQRSAPAPSRNLYDDISGEDSTLERRTSDRSAAQLSAQPEDDGDVFETQPYFGATSAQPKEPAALDHARWRGGPPPPRPPRVYEDLMEDADDLMEERHPD